MQKQKQEILRLHELAHSQRMQIVRLKKELRGVNMELEEVVRGRDRDRGSAAT